jgi:N-methylhydantoinase A
MIAETATMLDKEKSPKDRRTYYAKFDCRYLKQYHEVSFLVPEALLKACDTAAIAELFHDEHDRLYGYALRGDESEVEIINIRVQAVGETDKPVYQTHDYAGSDPSSAQKGTRSMYIPEDKEFRDVPVFDGADLKFGNQVSGPAMIEQVTTAIFVSGGFDCVCDKYGSFALYKKGREDLVQSVFEGAK